MKTIADACRDIGGLIGWKDGEDYIFWSEHYKQWDFTCNSMFSQNKSCFTYDEFVKYCTTPQEPTIALSVAGSPPAPLVVPPVAKVPAYTPVRPASPSATDFLNSCIDVQKTRGTEYQGDDSERSFQTIATTFNTITGRDLKASDICLLLTTLKMVRQYSNPERLHRDSILDGVSYMSLWAEELTKELT